MFTQGLIDQHQGLLNSQLGFYVNSSNSINTLPSINVNNNHQQSQHLKPLNNIPSSFAIDHALHSSTTTNPRDDQYISSSHDDITIPPLFSLDKSSSPSLWEWDQEKYYHGRKRSNNGEDVLKVSSMKMKKITKTRRKVREPRFCFKTRSDIDVLDDGYKWRKYGQKVVKDTLHPRSYYRCTQEKCRVKKKVERLAEDPRMVITSYEGRHAHSPSHDNLDHPRPSQPPLNNF